MGWDEMDLGVDGLEDDAVGSLSQDLALQVAVRHALHARVVAAVAARHRAEAPTTVPLTRRQRRRRRGEEGDGARAGEAARRRRGRRGAGGGECGAGAARLGWMRGRLAQGGPCVRFFFSFILFFFSSSLFISAFFCFFFFFPTVRVRRYSIGPFGKGNTGCVHWTSFRKTRISHTSTMLLSSCNKI